MWHSRCTSGAGNVHFADCQRTLRQRTCCIALRQSFLLCVDRVCRCLDEWQYHTLDNAQLSATRVTVSANSLALIVSDVLIVT